ncbi:unnamed protein product [Prunus armeniaca]
MLSFFNFVSRGGLAAALGLPAQPSKLHKKTEQQQLTPHFLRVRSRSFSSLALRQSLLKWEVKAFFLVFGVVTNGVEEPKSLDNEELQRGTTIAPELLTAIEQSRFAIVVLSPNYASSSWCLDEITKIVECMETRGTILPIFYHVDPSYVRKQMGSFAESFTKREEIFRKDMAKVRQWREALFKVANFSGWTSKDRYETELIKEIVVVVWNKVHPMLLGSANNLVGVDFRVKEINLLLDAEANDVRFIGIWGMGGMGKTTIARLVYERVFHNFEVSSFLANVREVSAKHGLVHLQKELLSQILKKESTNFWDVYSGTSMIKNYLCNKKVLLILDDIDELNQLQILLGEKHWFGLGSRIIITTRDQHLLVTHGVEKSYELEGLNEVEALQLFSWNAFKKDHPEDDYSELSKCFMEYAGGLPLALTTLGSFLYKRSRDAWTSALDKLKKAPNRTIFGTLKMSYDGLDEIERRIFLDVACFLKGYNKERTIEVLESYGFCPCITVDVLVEKSLLTISDNHVWMHDLIQEMEREIVRQESYEEPGRRSRLWHRDDILNVFLKNRVRIYAEMLGLASTGTKAIEGIVLHLPELEEAHWNPEAFSKMSKLSVICGLKSLQNLNMSGCSLLGNLPEILGEIECLEELDLSGTAIGEPPSSLALMKNLKVLSFCRCKGQPPKSWHSFLPFEFFAGKSSGPKGLVLASLKRFCSLKKLDLSDCNLCEGGIPDDIGCMSSLEELNLSGNNFVSLPASLRCLSKLWELNLESCKSLQQLPDLPSNRTLHGVRHSVLKFNIVIPGSEIPDWFSNQRVGDSLMVEWPPHLCNSKWMGFVLCAVFGAQENPAALLEFDSFGRHPCGILCYLEIAGSYQLSFPIPDEVYHSVGHVASDHLWLLYFSRKYHRCENFLKDNCSQVEVLFKPFCSVRNNTCLKLKKCGIHLVYGEDVEELNR